MKWFVFNTHQDFFFHFEFSVENISCYRNPMQPMDGFWQDQGACYLSDVSSVIIRMQYSVAKNVTKPRRGSRSKRQNECLISWPVQLTREGQSGGRDGQCSGAGMWWRAGRISEYAMPHPSSAKVHPTRDWWESPERLSMGGVSPTKTEECSNSQVLPV